MKNKNLRAFIYAIRDHRAYKWILRVHQFIPCCDLENFFRWQQAVEDICVRSGLEDRSDFIKVSNRDYNVGRQDFLYNINRHQVLCTAASSVSLAICISLYRLLMLNWFLVINLTRSCKEILPTNLYKSIRYPVNYTKCLSCLFNRARLKCTISAGQIAPGFFSAPPSFHLAYLLRREDCWSYTTYNYQSNT